MPVDPTPGEVLVSELTLPGTKIVARLASAVTADPDDCLGPANFTECTFPGYLPITLTDWEDVAADDTECAEVLSAILHFQPSGLLAPTEALAFYLTIQVGTDPAGLLQAEVFERPFVFRSDAEDLQRQVRVTQDLGTN